MPSAIKYIPPTKPNERKKFEMELQNEKTRQQKRYTEALRYYRGNQDKSYEVENDAPDDNTTINMVRLTVDRTKSFLFPALPAIKLDPESVEETDEEKWVKDFIEYNGGLKSFHMMALRGCLAGHVYVRVVPVEPELKGDEDFFPRMIVLEPTSVSTYWRANDVADVIWYEYRYFVDNVPYIEDVVKVDHGRSWVSYVYKGKVPAGLDQGSITHWGKASLLTVGFGNNTEETTYKLSQTIPHTHKIPPIIEWGHLPDPEDYYGLNEVTQKSLQDAINRIATERARIVRENSDPVDVATGVDADELEREGGLVTIPNQMARVTRLEMKGDLVGINSTLQNLVETYLAIAMVVLLKGDAKDLQRVTNASVRTLFLDMLSKNVLLQSAYGGGLKKIIKLALAMGIAHGAVKKGVNEIGKIITVNFGTALPIDLSEIANNNQLMTGMGAMSLQQAAEQYGLNWAEVKAQRASELEAQVEDQQAMMAAFPDQTVGPDGKPTGAPSPDKAHAMDIEKTKVQAQAKKPKTGA